MGPLVHLSIGLLVHWSIGPLVHWSSGPLGVSWGYLGHISGISQGYLKDILGISWGYLKDILGISLGYLGDIFGRGGKHKNFPGSDLFWQKLSSLKSAEVLFRDKYA